MGLFDVLNEGLENDDVAGTPNSGALGERTPQDEHIDKMVEGTNGDTEVNFDMHQNSQDPQMMANARNEALGQSMDPDLFKTPDLESGSFVDSGRIDANIAQQFGNSLIRGTGTVLGGFGDIFQAVPGLVGSAFGSEKGWRENTFSDFFHTFGSQMQADNQNFVPDEFKDIKLNSLASMEGWKYLISNQIAETIPYMAEFVLTGMGAGALAKKGASKLATKQLAKIAARSARNSGIKKAVGRGALKKSLEGGVEETLKKLTLKESGGLLNYARDRTERALLTDAGLSKTGQGIASTIGAGSANNQLIALSQAAESVNQAKALKDDNGNALFNEDELAQIGLDTWQTESAYIAADILSWGFTFGKVPKGSLSNIGVKTGQSLTKTTGGRIGKILFKAGVEGTEETIQEVFEEWAKKTSIEKAKMEKGLMTEEEYENSFSAKGFYDYYSSDETEGLRVVAGLTGGMMAGAKAAIDLTAEKSSLLRNKEELIKAQLERSSEPEMVKAQQQAKQRLIAQLVQEGYHDSLEHVMKGWVESGSATQEEYEELVKDTNEYVKVYNNSNNLNVNGVERLYNLLADNKRDEILIGKLKDEHHKELQSIKEAEMGKDAELYIAEKHKKEIDDQLWLNNKVKAHRNSIMTEVLKNTNRKASPEYNESVKKVAKLQAELEEIQANYFEGNRGVIGKTEELQKAQEVNKRTKKDIANVITGKEGEIIVDKETGEEIGIRGMNKQEYEAYTKTGADRKKARSATDEAKGLLSKVADAAKGLFKRKTKTDDESDNKEDESVDEVEETETDTEVDDKELSPEEQEENDRNDAEYQNQSFAEIISNQNLADGSAFDGKKMQDDFDAKFPKSKYTKEQREALSKKMQSAFAEDHAKRKAKKEEYKPTATDVESDKEVETPEEAEGKNSADNSGVPPKKTTRRKNGRKGSQGNSGRMRKGDTQVNESEKSEGRKKIEAAAKKEGKSIKGFISNAFEAIKKKATEVKNTKEVQDLINELENLEEFKDFKETKLYKEIQSFKKKQVLAKARVVLEDAYKQAKSPEARREAYKKLRDFKKNMDIRKSQETMNRVVIKDAKTSSFAKNLYTMEEFHGKDGYSATPGFNAKMSVIRANLKESHPDINVMVVDDLAETIGVDSLAYVIGSTIFINPHAMDNNNTLAHEMSHVYYHLTKGDEATKRLMKTLVQDKAALDKLKEGYWDEVKYTFKDADGNVDESYPSQLRDFNGDEFNSKEDFLNHFTENGYEVTENPIEEQDIIQDEMYAYHMEGVIANDHDAFFGQKAKKKRLAFYQKGYWQNVKSKLSLGFTPSVEKQKTIEYLKDLDINGIPEKTENLETFLQKEFKKGFSPEKLKAGMRNKGRRRIDMDQDRNVSNSMQNSKGVYDEEIFTNDDKWNETVGTLFNSLFNDHEDAMYEEIQYSNQAVGSGNLDDKSDANHLTVTKDLDSFIEDYNTKVVSGKDKTYGDVIITRDKIAGPIRHLATKYSHSNLEFIEALENTADENPIVDKYLDYLEDKHGDDYHGRLVSIHTVIGDDVLVDGFVTTMNEDGSFEVRSAISSREKLQSESIMGNIKSRFDAAKALNKKDPNLGSAKTEIGKSFNKLFPVLVKIQKDQPLTREDIFIINDNLFEDSGINMRDIKEVFYDSKLVPTRVAIKDALKKASSIDRVKGRGKIVFENGKIDLYKNLHIKKLIESVVAANRAHSGLTMAENAQGNNVNLTQKNSFLFNENKRLGNDVYLVTNKIKGDDGKLLMTKGAFNTKYGKNPIALAMLKKGGKLRFHQNLGMDTSNASAVYKGSKSNAVFLNDFLSFVKTRNDAEYMQSMPVSGESARRYSTFLPLLNHNDANSDSKRKEAIELSIRNGDKRFATESGNASVPKFKKALDDEFIKIKGEFEADKDLMFNIQKNMKEKILDKNGKLTTVGTDILKNYIYNHTLNQTYIRDLFYPGIAEQDFNKRGKGVIAPVTNINSSGKMKLGLIMVKDLKINSSTLKNSGLTNEEINSSDSMNFILPEDTERIQGLYGNAMKVNKVLKLFSYSKERENDKAMNKGVMIKGITFPLTDEFIAENPGYKGLRDALRMQRDYYVQNINKGAPLPFNLNNGMNNFLPIAAAESSLKTGLDTNNENHALTTEELNDPKTVLKKITALNSYKGGYGFSGADIGIQNLMDKGHTQSVMPSQFISNLLTRASDLGHLDKVESMQKRILDISQANVREKILQYLPKNASDISQNDLDKLQKYVINNTNPDLIDPVTRNILENNSVSVPFIHEKVSQIMKNALVKEGLRMYTDGTMGLQMADFGMYKVTGKTEDGKSNTYDSDLKSYGVGENSTTWKDTNGKEHKATTPAEAKIPYEFATKAGTRLRQYYNNESDAKTTAKSISKEKAYKLGLKGGTSEFNNYIEKHTALLVGKNTDNKSKDFYFVRGEMFLASRIPSHGLQLTLVVEAKETTAKGTGSAVIVPSELSSIMGSDFDGDALFMNMDNNEKYYGKNSKESSESKKSYERKQALKDDMIDYLTRGELQEDLMTSLDMKTLKDEVAKEVELATGVKLNFSKYKTDENGNKTLDFDSSTYPSLPTGQREAFKDNVETRSLVGLGASLHRFTGLLAAYDTPFDLPLSINGVSKTSFSDKGGYKSRSYKTAILLNIILDNANEKAAEKMGISPSTASQFILLAGMGYEIAEISAIMKSEGALAWSKASNNRDNPFYEDSNKFEVLLNAQKFAGISSKTKVGKNGVSITTKNKESLNSELGKANVIQLLNKLDEMQSEAFKVNSVLSSHKSLNSNPFILEKQLKNFNDNISGDGVIKYSPKFLKNPLVQKYKQGLEFAIDMNKKTNTSYSATSRNIMKSIEDVFKKDFTAKDYNLITSKLMKYISKEAMEQEFSLDLETVKNDLYEGDTIFDRLSQHFILNSLNGNESALANALVIHNQSNNKRITLNQNLTNYGTDEQLELIREEFGKLPEDLKNDLVVYDYIENGLYGKNSIYPAFDKENMDKITKSFDKILSKNYKSKHDSTLYSVKDEMYRSLHSLTKEFPIYKAHEQDVINTPSLKNKFKSVDINSELGKLIIDNKSFVRRVDQVDANGNKIRYIIKSQPLSNSEMADIMNKNGDIDKNNLSDGSKKDIIIKALNKPRGEFMKQLGKPINLSNLRNPKNELYNDVNILNADTVKSNPTPQPPSKPKVPVFNRATNTNSGRRRFEGAMAFKKKMSKDAWKNRNDLSGTSTEINESFAEYEHQYEISKNYYDENLANDQVEGMTDNEINSVIAKFKNYQAEAAAIALAPLEHEIGRRISIHGSKVTGVNEDKDLNKLFKWFGSNNIPSHLPAMQALARKVSERFKDFLRNRNNGYEKIDTATKALYKSKFNSRFVRYNPFKGKDHYEQLYGNLVIKEKVGEDNTNNIRLKPKGEIERLFRTGKLSKEEKNFYDVFTSITKEYEGLLEGGKKRGGYIPHTKQSLLESYSNRGLLGSFMNAQTTEDKVRDVVLKGYDPIEDKIVTQSFKKFEDAYNAASENKEFGNSNKWKAKDIFLLKKRAQILQSKGINEDGTSIKMSSFSIDTLANSGVRNRFTNQRSDKATLYPSMDLNKAIMDFTHSSAFASSFRDMLPEVQGVIEYYKSRGNENAVKLLEVYYRDKILRGKAPVSVAGKYGDKGIKLLNAVTVFKLLGFQTAFVAGNIIAGKYHNIKNDSKNGKSWAKGEKRFWGFDGGEKGIKHWYSNFQDSMDFLRKIGFMEQNVYEDINLEKEWNPINKLETLALLPMTLSEKWIQGVEFLGKLSDEEWNDWKQNRKMISVEKQSQYEDDVKKSQGRGYNFTDQRMISMYSLGQSFMMFSKFIPTMINDRFNQEEIDAYNRKNIGSLRQFGSTAKDVISGRMRYSEFKEYREKLPDHRKEALDKAVRGMALVTLAAIAGGAAGAVGDDDTKYLMGGLVLDANYALNLPKLSRKLKNNPVVSTVNDALNEQNY